jgi:hypothetical protein
MVLLPPVVPIAKSKRSVFGGLMFRAMLFSFLAGVMVSQPLQDWASDRVAGASRQLGVMMNVGAYDQITAALR